MKQSPPAQNTYDLASMDSDTSFLLICFSHLRWDFVFQRPQHLMSRFVTRNPVLFWEEPIFSAEATEVGIEIRTCPASGVMVQR